MEGLRPEDPDRVGRYRLLKRLGSGGMGRVYLGQSPSGRQVAVKIIRAELADNPDFRQRFRQEVKAARRVGGIFTAPVVDADPDAPEPWMVTAFVSGPSLAEAVASRGPMPVGAVLILAAGLAEGLSSVHAAGLVHRDLKPSNVLLASDGPRIIDFGISRSAQSVGPTRAGGVIGSPGFMSPEQALGDVVGPPSDIFSLGSVLAYAATGTPPFGDGPPSALLYRVVHGEAAIGDVPPQVRPLVARCLLSDPAARPTTEELLGELGEAAPVQGWLDWQAGAEEPASQATNTVTSGAWAGSAVAAQPAAEMLAVPGVPDDDGQPAARAEVRPSGESASAGQVPGVAAATGAGWPEGPAAGDSGGDAAGGSTPVGSIGWLFPDPSDAPSGAGAPPFRQHRRRAGLAAAGVLGVAIVVALAIWLLPRLNPNPSAAGPAAGAGTTPSAQATTPPHQHRTQTGTASPATGSSPGLTASGSLSPLEVAEANVVLAYFDAINKRRLPTAWALGGDNLYPSTTDLITSYADISNVAVRILGVRGDIVFARITTTNLTGAAQAHAQAFEVRNGAIVASRPAPSGLS